MTDDVQRALDKALRALSTRAHSEQEIVRKLTRAGFEERAIAEAMAKLASYRLTDDAAFASQWARSRARRGMGPYRIARELRDKGIAREESDAALAALDEDASLDAATQLAAKHLQRGDERAKKRAYDALIRRGYSYDTARKALADALAAISEEADLGDEG